MFRSSGSDGSLANSIFPEVTLCGGGIPEFGFINGFILRKERLTLQVMVTACDNVSITGRRVLFPGTH